MRSSRVQPLARGLPKVLQGKGKASTPHARLRGKDEDQGPDRMLDVPRRARSALCSEPLPPVLGSPEDSPIGLSHAERHAPSLPTAHRGRFGAASCSSRTILFGIASNRTGVRRAPPAAPPRCLPPTTLGRARVIPCRQPSSSHRRRLQGRAPGSIDPGIRAG